MKSNLRRRQLLADAVDGILALSEDSMRRPMNRHQSGRAGPTRANLTVFAVGAHVRASSQRESDGSASGADLVTYARYL